MVLNYKKIFCLHSSPGPPTHLFTARAEYAKIKDRVQAAQQARKTAGRASSAISAEVLLLVLPTEMSMSHVSWILKDECPTSELIQIKSSVKLLTIKPC